MTNLTISGVPVLQDQCHHRNYVNTEWTTETVEQCKNTEGAREDNHVKNTKLRCRLITDLHQDLAFFLFLHVPTFLIPDVPVVYTPVCKFKYEKT